MEITDLKRQRLTELIQGKLAEMYHYSVPKITELSKELNELVLNNKHKEFRFKLKAQIMQLVEKHVQSNAERNDEIAGQYIERFTKEAIDDIEHKTFVRIINKETSEVKAYPFIPDSHSDLSTLLGMLNKMKKKRKSDLHNNDNDPYLEALQDVREMARKIYRGDSDVTYDYQHKVCIICHIPFKEGSKFEFVNKRGYKHPQVDEYELTFPNAESIMTTCKLNDYAE